MAREKKQNEIYFCQSGRNVRGHPDWISCSANNLTTLNINEDVIDNMASEEFPTWSVSSDSKEYAGYITSQYSPESSTPSSTVCPDTFNRLGGSLDGVYNLFGQGDQLSDNYQESLQKQWKAGNNTSGSSNSLSTSTFTKISCDGFDLDSGADHSNSEIQIEEIVESTTTLRPEFMCADKESTSSLESSKPSYSEIAKKCTSPSKPSFQADPVLKSQNRKLLKSLSKEAPEENNKGKAAGARDIKKCPVAASMKVDREGEYIHPKKPSKKVKVPTASIDSEGCNQKSSSVEKLTKKGKKGGEFVNNKTQARLSSGVIMDHLVNNNSKENSREIGPSQSSSRPRHHKKFESRASSRDALLMESPHPPLKDVLNACLPSKESFQNFCQSLRHLLISFARVTWNGIKKLVVLLFVLLRLMFLCIVFLGYCAVGRARFYLGKVGKKLLRVMKLLRCWRHDTREAPHRPSKSTNPQERAALPTSSDEALKRLLSCKDNDPYSILGVPCTASDEEIKRCYRRQAMLVHPDKNKQAGAEEAFKVLGHAFELIGEPSRRIKYEDQKHETQNAEEAMKMFANLLSKLQERVEEANSQMACCSCQKSHRRYVTERAWYRARACASCGTQHSAKEGDIWVESSYVGFLWHYYACMEGKIYNITEWAKCQKERFKHMKPDSHNVIYRLSSKGHNKTTGGQRSNEEIQEMLRKFIQQAQSGSGNMDGGEFEQNQQGSHSKSRKSKKKRK